MNNGNICAGLMVGNKQVDNPFEYMYGKQLELQTRLQALVPAEQSMQTKALSVTYWRHCAQSELDEMLEWFPIDNDDSLKEVQMEFIDVLHFVFNMGLEVRISHEQFSMAMTAYYGDLKPMLNPLAVVQQVLGVSARMTTYVDTLPWKTWKTYSDESFSLSKSTSEYYNLLKSMCNLGSTVGLDLQLAFNTYLAKNKENHRRQDDGY